MSNLGLDKPRRTRKPVTAVAGFSHARMTGAHPQESSVTNHALNLASSGELIAAIPFLLGFHSRRSVVLMALQQRRLSLTQRLDLPDAGQEYRAAEAMIRPLARDQANSTLLIGYEDMPGQSRLVMDQLSDLLVDNQFPVIDRIVVRDGRWRSVDCDNPDCCPPNGTRVPNPADVAHITAEFVGTGVAPLPARVDLQDSVEAQPSAAHVRAIIDRIDAGSEEAGPAGGGGDAAAGSWARVLDPRPDAPSVSEGDAALVLVSLRELGIRDGIVSLLMPSTLAADHLPADVRELTQAIRQQIPVPLVERGYHREVQERLTALCRLAPDEYAAPPLTILASYAWWRGDGVTARVALDRALRWNPGYRLARLLEAMLDLGIAATDC
jgi:hypothetical protein